MGGTRIRKIDYTSEFVPQDQVDESKHMYLRDDGFIGRMRADPDVRMEFLEQCRINSKREKYVFVGYKIVSSDACNDELGDD